MNPPGLWEARYATHDARRGSMRPHLLESLNVPLAARLALRNQYRLELALIALHMCDYRFSGDGIDSAPYHVRRGPPSIDNCDLSVPWRWASVVHRDGIAIVDNLLVLDATRAGRNAWDAIVLGKTKNGRPAKRLLTARIVRRRGKLSMTITGRVPRPRAKPASVRTIGNVDSGGRLAFAA